MQYDNPDRVSTRSRRSVSSVLSSIWSKIPSSSRTMLSPIASICSYIDTTPDAGLAPIMELIVRKEEGGFQHEFVLIRLAKPTGEDFWVRLERRPRGLLPTLVSSVSEATDTAILSGKVDSLLDGKKSVERMKAIFHTHPSLRDLFHVLDALGKESKSYSVWPQNCYFFASVVAEHLCGLDGTAELSGTLRWLDLGLPIRRRIHESIMASYGVAKVMDVDSDILSTTSSRTADFQRIIQQFEKRILEKLNKIPHVGVAGYESGRPNAPVRCLEDTRTAILKKIWCWIGPPTPDAATEPTSDTIDKPTILDTAIEHNSGTPVNPSSGTAVEPIYWVNGVAGIGKSTIARRVAEDAKGRELLGASFFFSRQEKSSSNPHLFISTIAYQLAWTCPGVRSVIIHALRHDPDIMEKSFAIQFKKLITEPLCKITSKRVVIVVDALDECDNSEGAADRLFRAIIAHCAEAPYLRLLVTSRPETYIRALITGAGGNVLHEDIDQCVVSADIRKYLGMEMSKIPKKLGVDVPLPWPSEEDLTEMVKRAEKLFIWADMAVRFVGDHRGRGPISGLKTLLSPESIDLNSDSPNPYMHLDNLYSSILSQAVEDLGSVGIEDMKIVVGTFIQLRSEMPLEAIVRFLGDDENKVEMTLNRLQLIIPIPTDPSQPIQIWHPSFPDFVTSRERCPDSRIYVDTSTHERRLALQSLDILNKRLSEGVETLLKPIEKADAVSKDAILCTIPQEVQYACRFWAVHVAFSSMNSSDEELMERLDLFSSTKLLRWVVSMCLLDAIPDAIAAASSMQQWMDSSGPWSYLKERFYDTERMLLANSDLISRHPAQLYYSVLPFLPSDTYIARQYPAPRGCISVLTGRENSWPPLLFTLPPGDTVAFAPSGHMFASAIVEEDEIHLYSGSNGLLNSSIRSFTTTNSPNYDAHSIAFTEDGCGIVVVSSAWSYSESKVSYQIEKLDLVKRNGQIYRIILRDDSYCLKLSEYGSYVAVAEHKNKDTRICIWKTNGSDDISIPLRAGEVSDLDLTGESAYLVAVAAKDITILSIPSGGVQRTLYDEARVVRISRDGLFIASLTGGDTRLWSITQGTLLAMFETGWDRIVFSRTNRLYATQSSDGDEELKVYDASADPNTVTIKSFPLPSRTISILPMPDESRILVHTWDDIQVWSLGQFTVTCDAPRNDIVGIHFSGDASLLALATETDIEIWDARIGQRRKVIQRRNWSFRPIAFSPKGELIVSSSDGRIIVMDVVAGVLLPTAYSFPPQRRGRIRRSYIGSVGISYDSSKLAATRGYRDVWNVWKNDICVWDLPSGTLLYGLECDGYRYEIQWSWTDQYLLFKDRGEPRYLNAETFQEEVLEHPGDRFQRHNHLYHEGNRLRIRLSSGREGPLFSALPLNLDVKYFSWQGDRACIISKDRRLFLLNTSGLEAYMEIYNLRFEPEATDVGDGHGCRRRR